MLNNFVRKNNVQKPLIFISSRRTATVEVDLIGRFKVENFFQLTQSAELTDDDARHVGLMIS